MLTVVLDSVFQGTFINDFAAFKQYTLAYAGVTAKVSSSAEYFER